MSELIVAKPWELIEPGIINPVRNTDHTYLKFINTEVFSTEARHFLKYGYYTTAPPGTIDYINYWDEQERRCLEGYSVGGVRIPGRYYFYLNFCQIVARPIDPNTGEEKENAKKILTFPRFLDHQYYLFLEIEECFAEGPHRGKSMHGLVILKSRRKGLTYCVTGGVYNYNFQFQPSSMNILAGYEKTHYETTLKGIHASINHINKSTDWAKRRGILNKRDHFRASYSDKNELGIDVEQGYLSEIQAISFKDNPFKSIGTSLNFLGFEEAGKFNNLIEAYAISEPTLRDGDITTGVHLIWGSAGDMEGGSADLAEIFYKPEAYGCKSYENIYDENSIGDCGLFIDDMWYYPGSVNVNGKTELFVDVEGNSNRVLAENSLDAKRLIKKKGSRLAYQKFITQQPKNPKEALLRAEGNRFNAIRAQARLGMIMANSSVYIDSIWVGRLQMVPESRKIDFVFDDSLIPLRDFPIRNNDKPGALEIYEHPVADNSGVIPYGRYIFGIDTYDDDYSTTTSVGSCIGLDTYTDRIVCHYKGRPEANVFYENVLKIIKYYNGIGNYEKNKKGLYGYFYNRQAIHLLCDEPEILKEKGISKANVIGNNRKGTNGTTPVNAYGLELLSLWLDRPAYEEDDPEILIMDRLRSIGMLKELIGWNPDDNFDDVSALGMLMILREDRLRLIKRVDSATNSFANDAFWSKSKISRIKREIKYGNKNVILSQAKISYLAQKQAMEGGLY